MKYAHCLALSALLLCPALDAQEDVMAESAGAAVQKTVTLEFRGGKLSELIADIRKAADGANIVASALASEVELPAITLRNASVHQALQATRDIVPSPYAVSVQEHKELGAREAVYSVQVVEIQRTANQTYQGRDSRGVRVFSIKSLIEALPSDPPGFADKLLSANTVLSAVENGLEVGRGPGEAAKWDMRYHEDSKLLFVSADHEQLALVHEVLQALERDAQQARISAGQASRMSQTGGQAKKDR